MNELELLERYEPVLRFAKSERFFPMAVEHYVERCSIFASGPKGVAELISHRHEPLIKRIGRLKSEQFYLRFINKPLNDSDAWVWWAALSIVGLVGGWFLARILGLEIALASSSIAALLIFMFASPIRLRIIPAALAALFFITLEIVPIWFFLRRSEYISAAMEYFVLLPIYLIALFYLSVRTMKFVLDRVIPEGPGMVMDVLSQATEKIAREAYFEYSKILEKDSQPVYYGRVLRKTDSDSNHWTILQYHFFYAFNDWRLAANGMNHHEGDWEMVAVYLKNNAPYAVLFSQHGAGNIEKWESVHLALDDQGNRTTHPVVYVALGSHANYSKPEVIRSPSMYKAGKLQRFLYWIDGLIHYIFLLLNPNQKARQIAMKEISAAHGNFLTRDAFSDMRDETDHYIVSLPMEMATGDGFRIGCGGDDSSEDMVNSTDYLKSIMSDRETTCPKISKWSRVLLNSEVDWLQYKGLWGVKSLLKDESGPPGPRWDRPRKDVTGVKERMRWDKPLDWLAELEKLSH
jgi:hypothetical protein